MTSSKKLVDKYQYKENEVKSDGLVDIITAKHIILKQNFTLKKICLTDQKCLVRQSAIFNQMNIYKHMGSRQYLFRCHKMIKTSHNLYVVYDQMGNHPTLAQLIQNQKLKLLTKKKKIALQILQAIKQFQSLDIFFLDLNTKIIQVNEKQIIHFTNLENAIFSNKNAHSSTFLNIKVSSDLAPQLKELIEDCCSLPIDKDIDYTLFNQKLNKVDLYAYGKILKALFQTQLNQQQNYNQIQAGFFKLLNKFIKKLLSQQKHQRPSLDEIQGIFSQKKIEISALKDISKVRRPYRDNLMPTQSAMGLKKSKSQQISLHQINLLKSMRQLSPVSSNLIKNSPQITGQPSFQLNNNKSNFSFDQALESKNHNEQYKTFVQKIIKRRNLCKFLLNLAKIIFGLQVVNQSLRMMLGFVLIKKSVLLICGLACYISTGKVQSQQFILRDPLRKQFIKTNDFTQISISINQQMDIGRCIYQTLVEILNTEFLELSENNKFNFISQSKSEQLNQDIIKQLIYQSIIQILHQFQTPIQPSEFILKNQSIHTQSNQVSDSTRLNKKSSIRDFDDNSQIRKINSHRQRISKTSTIGYRQINQKSFSNEKILRLMQLDTLINLYLMVLILDYETFEKMFQNIINDQILELNKQSFYKQLMKMQPKQILFKIYQIVS